MAFALCPSDVELTFPRSQNQTIVFRLLKPATDLADPSGPIDITDETVKFTVRETKGGVLVFEKINTPGNHLFPLNGETLFTILQTEIDDETSTTQVTRWVYSVTRVQAVSAVETVMLEGALFFKPIVDDV